MMFIAVLDQENTIDYAHNGWPKLHPSIKHV